MDTQNGKKRKLSIEQDGSENTSKHHHEEHPSETIAKENGGLPNFNLPSELLVKIIDMVPISQWASLEFVSHQFQDVVHGLWGKLKEIRLDELAYNEEKKMADPCQIVEELMGKFLIRAPKVSSVSGLDEIKGKHNCYETTLAIIRVLSKFEHLQTIDFSERTIGAKAFDAFYKSSASRQCWKRLNIKEFLELFMSPDGFFCQENQRAMNLECFKFNACSLGTFKNVFLPIQWSGLKKLVIADSSVHGNPIRMLSIIRQCTQLTHLAVQFPQCGGMNGQPSYIEFMQGISALDNLSLLEINVYQLRDGRFYAAMLMLIQELGQLGRMAHFAVKGHVCGDRLLAAIIDHLPHLGLDINHVDGSPQPLLVRLAVEMRQLVNFKLKSFVSEVDSTVIRAIGGNMSSLQCLHLQYWHRESEEEDLASLSHLRKLKELRIMRKSIDRGPVESWTRLGFGSCLETLELSFGDGISSEKGIAT